MDDKQNDRDRNLYKALASWFFLVVIFIFCNGAFASLVDVEVKPGKNQSGIFNSENQEYRPYQRLRNSYSSKDVNKQDFAQFQQNNSDTVNSIWANEAENISIHNNGTDSQNRLYNLIRSYVNIRGDSRSTRSSASSNRNNQSLSSNQNRNNTRETNPIRNELMDVLASDSVFDAVTSVLQPVRDKDGSVHFSVFGAGDFMLEVTQDKKYFAVSESTTGSAYIDQIQPPGKSERGGQIAPVNAQGGIIGTTEKLTLKQFILTIIIDTFTSPVFYILLLLLIVSFATYATIQSRKSGRGKSKSLKHKRRKRKKRKSLLGRASRKQHSSIKA